MSQLFIGYKNDSPDALIYRDECVQFKRHNVGGGKIGYMAMTSDGYMVVHGAAGCVAEFEPGSNTPILWRVSKFLSKSGSKKLAVCLKVTQS